MDRQSENRNAASVRLEITRLKAGQILSVQFLSPRYGGLYTHWTRGRSQACRGADCVPAVHKGEQIWKGYVASAVWVDSVKRWHPTVFEITEALELELRGHYARGQIWRLIREPEGKKKRSPVRGKLLETRDERETPPAFDIIPALVVLYHWPELALDAESRLPTPVCVVPSAGRAPAATTQAEPQKPAPTTFSFAERHRAQMNGIGVIPIEDRDSD
jgi:hypothetical protein